MSLYPIYFVNFDINTFSDYSIFREKVGESVRTIILDRGYIYFHVLNSRRAHNNNEQITFSKKLMEKFYYSCTYLKCVIN